MYMNFKIWRQFPEQNIDQHLHEGFVTVLSKHGDYCIQDNLSLGQICGGTLNEHIPRLQGDLWMLAWNKSKD